MAVLAPSRMAVSSFCRDGRHRTCSQIGARCACECHGLPKKGVAEATIVQPEVTARPKVRVSDIASERRRERRVDPVESLASRPEALTGPPSQEGTCQTPEGLDTPRQGASGGCQGDPIQHPAREQHHPAFRGGRVPPTPYTRARPGIQPGDGDPRHGTPNGYNNLKCSCGPCRRAWRQVCNSYNHRTGRRQPMADHLAGLTVTHGIRATYTNGCHCPECKTAERDYKRGYRQAKTA